MNEARQEKFPAGLRHFFTMSRPFRPTGHHSLFHRPVECGASKGVVKCYFEYFTLLLCCAP